MNQVDQSGIVKASMLSLLGNPSFQVYMEEVRAMKDLAVRDAVNDLVVGDVGKMSAALGSIRTYLDLLDAYDEASANPQQIGIDESKEN